MKGTDRADRLAGKVTSTVACVSDLKRSGTACGHKTKDITPSIAWRKETKRQRERKKDPQKKRLAVTFFERIKKGHGQSWPLSTRAILNKGHSQSGPY